MIITVIFIPICGIRNSAKLMISISRMLDAEFAFSNPDRSARRKIRNEMMLNITPEIEHRNKPTHSKRVISR